MEYVQHTHTTRVQLITSARKIQRNYTIKQQKNSINTVHEINYTNS